MIIHNSKDSTFFGDIELLGGYVRPNQAKKKYAHELVDYNVHGITKILCRYKKSQKLIGG